MTRLSGFYWVSLRGAEPVVAEWTGGGLGAAMWKFTDGGRVHGENDAVRVIGARLLPPVGAKPQPTPVVNEATRHLGSHKVCCGARIGWACKCEVAV